MKQITSSLPDFLSPLRQVIRPEDNTRKGTPRDLDDRPHIFFNSLQTLNQDSMRRVVLGGRLAMALHNLDVFAGKRRQPRSNSVSGGIPRARPKGGRAPGSLAAGPRFRKAVTIGRPIPSGPRKTARQRRGCEHAVCLQLRFRASKAPALPLAVFGSPRARLNGADDVPEPPWPLRSLGPRAFACDS